MGNHWRGANFFGGEVNMEFRVLVGLFGGDCLKGRRGIRKERPLWEGEAGKWIMLKKINGKARVVGNVL